MSPLLPLMAKVLFSLVRDLLRRTQAGSHSAKTMSDFIKHTKSVGSGHPVTAQRMRAAQSLQLQQFPFELCQVKPKQIDFLIINCSLRSGCNQDVVDRWTMDMP